MIRFFRIVLFLMGLLLYMAVAARMVQPAETTQNYIVIVGDRPGSRCCLTYMVNPDRDEANRARISVLEQPIATSSISPSRKWRFAHVQTQTGRLVYLIRLGDDGFMRLPDEVGQGRYVHWDAEEDILYYIGSTNRPTLALHRLTPDDPTPKRLTSYLFQDIRAIHQQPLPRLPGFAPLSLIVWALSALFLAAVLRPKR